MSCRVWYVGMAEKLAITVETDIPQEAAIAFANMCDSPHALAEVVRSSGPGLSVYVRDEHDDLTRWRLRGFVTYRFEADEEPVDP